MTAVDDFKAILLPFYVLVDVSWSMTTQDRESGTGMDAVNRIGPQVADALDKNPLVGDKVRFGLVDFSGDARVVIPLCDIRQIDELPALEARTDGTSFANAFIKMRQQIEADVQQLKADGYKVHRPAVFFLTDGEPTDEGTEWKQAFDSLTAADFRARPNVIPFGVRDASKTVLDQIVFPVGKMRSFLANDKPAAKAINDMIEFLISSIVESGTDVDEQGTAGGFKLPEIDDEEGDWI